jgi:putative hydrolase of the HAD superfamily
VSISHFHTQEQVILQRPNAIIFDYGNTLLIEDYFDVLAGTRRILQFAVSPATQTAEEITAESECLSREIDKIRTDTMQEYPYQCFQRVLYESLGLHFTLAPAEMEREFWRAAERFQPAPGVYSLLAYLHDQHIKTGIISNCPFTAAVMSETLVENQLAEHFAFLISSADYGFRKPHPRLFQVALKKLGLAPQDVWFVGDNPDCDVKGALDSGLFPIWYNRLDQTNELKYEYLEVKSWPQLVSFLESCSESTDRSARIDELYPSSSSTSL